MITVRFQSSVKLRYKIIDVLLFLKLLSEASLHQFLEIIFQKSLFLRTQCFQAYFLVSSFDSCDFSKYLAIQGQDIDSEGSFHKGITEIITAWFLCLLFVVITEKKPFSRERILQ